MRNKPTTPEQQLGLLTIQLAAMMDDDQECFNKAIGKIAEIIKLQQYNLANKKLHATNSRNTTTNSNGATNSDALPALQQGELVQQLEKYCKTLIAELQGNTAWYNLQCVNVSEASDLLGVKEDCIRGWIENKLIVASVQCGRYYIRTRDIDEFLSKNATAIPVRYDDFRTKRRTHLKNRFNPPVQFKDHHDGY